MRIALTALLLLGRLSPAGSSTGQAPGHDSEVLLKPVRIFPDPFRGAPNILVLCECIAPDMTPIPSNTRRACGGHGHVRHGMAGRPSIQAIRGRNPSMRGQAPPYKTEPARPSRGVACC